MKKQRKLLLINLLKESEPSRRLIQFESQTFQLIEHFIGWKPDLAEALIQENDGLVDAIAVSGVQRKIGSGANSLFHPLAIRFMKSATKSNVYFSDSLRDFFANWSLQKILVTQPDILKNKKVLFHSGLIGSVVEMLTNFGVRTEFLDLLTVFNRPVSFGSPKGLDQIIRAIRLAGKAVGLDQVSPLRHLKNKKYLDFLKQKVGTADIFVTFGQALDQIEDLNFLQGKLVLVDFLTAKTAETLSRVQNVQILKYFPDHDSLKSIEGLPFSVLGACLDIQNRSYDFDEYVLNWIQKSNIVSNTIASTDLRASETIVKKRKCAFVIHPLSQDYLWKVPFAKTLKNAPGLVRGLIEKEAASLPVFKYGTISGIKSAKDGTEVECEIYGYLATPKEMLARDPEVIYNKMVGVAQKAKQNGATLIGLGAYTKVVGDAGLTISKRSPIPVTNGNSYSAATTLWAARTIHDKLGFNHRKVAMVIGATGSIGRVSAILLAEVFEELILVATRAEKLLELRNDILRQFPNKKIFVTVRADKFVGQADLIVTATSNLTGKRLLNIDKVKPGAVICDCSRPLDFSKEDAKKRPDVIIVESGEVELPGNVKLGCDIGLQGQAVYACLAETVLLSLEGREEPFSISKKLSPLRVKEIYKLGIKHGATLSKMRGPLGEITEEQIQRCRQLVLKRDVIEARIC